MIHANRRNLSRQQGGFSLIEALLALGIAILIAGVALTGIRRDNESNQAKAVGEQAKMVGSALNTYVSLRYDTLVAHVPGTDDVGDPGTAADPGPRTCVWQNSPANTLKMCTITSETLRRNGLLPNSFSGYNAFGSTYEYRIRIDTAGASPMVDGMAWTTDAYIMEGKERYDLLGQAMLVAGADSGMTRSTATRVEGFNGAWSESGMGVNKLGVLAYRVGYNTFGYAAYLRLNGGQMLGDIDMGNNQIFGLDTIKTKNLGVEYARFKQDQKAIVFSDASSFDTSDDSAIGAAGTNDPVIMASTFGGTPHLALQSDAPVEIQTTSGADGTLHTGQLNSMNIAAQGTITSVGQIRTGTQVIAGAGGASANTYIFGGADGGIYFNSGITTPSSATTSGIQLTSATNTLTLTNNANLYTGGDIRSANNITADNKLIAGNTVNKIININPTITPTQGSAGVGATLCSGNPSMIGTIARSVSGDLVQCVQDGYWRTMGTSASSLVQITGAQACTGNGAAGNVVTMTCPTGTMVVSGGYSWPGGASNAPRAAPIVNFRSSANSWRVQAGATQAYSDSGGTANVPSCFDTYALCAL